MSRRGLGAALLCWLPVGGIVAVLFVAPSSTGTAALSTLSVTPGGGSYGGQAVRFQGDMGDGQQRIYLQRRGNPTAAWAGVVDPRTGRQFSVLTAANGEFDFTFPAPAMNEVYFRLHSRSADTPAHLFRSVHQDAEVDLVELDPADVPLPRGFAVVDEPFTIAVDTVRTTKDGKPTKPVLLGRKVTLQRRDSAGQWDDVEATTIPRGGRLDFGQEQVSAVTPEPRVYRARLEDWTANGDQVGWFPSLPYYLEVVERPAPVENLQAQPVPTTSKVALVWTLPVDPERDKIVIARTTWGADPDASKPSHVIATLSGGAMSYVDSYLIAPSTQYNYAVYTRSDDGVYTRISTDLSVRTPDAKVGAP